MSYENLPAGLREDFGPWGAAEAFGGGSLTHQIIGPKGCVGFLRDIAVDLTVAAVGTTTVPEIQLGISSGDFTYGRYRLGSAAGTGYNTGMHRAGAEPLVVSLNNPGRQLADFAGHVVLDGGAYTSIVNAGGSSSTVVPAGRIPASGMVVSNVVNGTGNVVRIFLRDPIDALLKTGQLVQVLGVGGATGIPTTATAISAISLAQNYIELSGTTFGGTYTAGGIVNIVVVVTELAGTGGAPAGTGHVKVWVDWQGGAQM